MNPFSIALLVFAAIALIATGFPEARGESFAAAGVFIVFALLTEFIPRWIARRRTPPA